MWYAFRLRVPADRAFVRGAFEAALLRAFSRPVGLRVLPRSCLARRLGRIMRTVHVTALIALHCPTQPARA